MTTPDGEYTSSPLNAGLINLMTNLSTGERPILTATIGDSRFPSMEELMQEMRKHQAYNQRDLANRLDMFLRVGMVPLVNDPHKKRLVLGINYQNGDGAVRDVGEIEMNLGTEVLPYNGYSELNPEIVLLDQTQFERLSGVVRDSTKRMSNTSRIPTVLSNPTTRDLFYEMLKQAIQNRVSDIHIEPLGNKSSRVRYRIDGSLSVADVNLTPDSHRLLVGIIKTDAKLTSYKAREPQDGVITFDDVMTAKHPELNGYSLRISTAPVNHGEKAALRLLREQQKSYGLESLGYSHDLYLKIRTMAESPDGLILVTGPTGSGKTTTLYSILDHLNNEDVNIVTIEEPIETSIPGINQSPVNRDIGWDFSKMLRTFLRQDPDIILVGEIRDTETAKAAIEAAKTGHLVLSTLHTIDGISTLLRLYELGVESSDLQSSLNGVVAQRLVRKVCPSCRIEYDAALELNTLLDTDVFSKGPLLYRRSGIVDGDPCKACNGIGYHGRMVIPEVWVLGDEERDLIGEGCKSMVRYREISIRNGLKPIGVVGMEAVVAGKTTLDEITSNVVKRSDLLKRREDLIKMMGKS